MARYIKKWSSQGMVYAEEVADEELQYEMEIESEIACSNALLVARPFFTSKT